MKLLRIVFVTLAASLGVVFSQVTPPPNILLFLVDDLGWQDTAVPLHDSAPFRPEMTAFNRRYRTPNVEKLAERGVVFTQAYASAPVCTPTRTSIMTGQSPGQTGITYWTLHANRDTSARHPLLRPPPWNLNALQPGEVTLPALLRERGYRTIHVGKAHLGARGTPGSDPENLGFDVNVAGHGAGGPGSYLGVHRFSAAHRGGGAVWDVPGLEAWHGEEVFLTEVLADEAKKAVAAAVADERPFFLQMAPYAVHTPIMANRRYAEHYEGLHPKEAAYATMIETVDAALGALVEQITELGVAERTVVIFTSDNGGLSAHGRGGERHTHNAPLRSGKGSAYEGGIRVPLIIAGAGVTRGGFRCGYPVVSHDLFPTVLAMAGAASPAEYAATVEGRDLVPLLRREEPAGTWRERAICWHQPHFWGVRGPGIDPFSAIRRGDWKLIYFHAPGRLELYDLSRDIGEAEDLAAAQPKRVQTLAEELSAWCERVGAQMSIEIESDRPVPLPRECAPRPR